MSTGQTPTTSTDLARHLAVQMDWHWHHQVRPRLEGLTDEEYTFDPTTDGSAWTVRQQDGTWFPDFVMPEPVPAPFTTIAWRLAHVIVGVLAMRSHSHAGGPEADYQTWAYAGTADEALAQLDTEYERWMTYVRSLDDAELAQACGPAEGEYAAWPLVDLVLHINRELIHHLAEIALLRDLYAHSR